MSVEKGLNLIKLCVSIWLNSSVCKYRDVSVKGLPQLQGEELEGCGHGALTNGEEAAPAEEGMTETRRS